MHTLHEKCAFSWLYLCHIYLNLSILIVRLVSEAIAEANQHLAKASFHDVAGIFQNLYIFKIWMDGNALLIAPVSTGAYSLTFFP